MDSKLLCKVHERIERAARVEAFLVLTVAALHLTVVPRGIRAYQLMPDGRAAFRRANLDFSTDSAIGVGIMQPLKRCLVLYVVGNFPSARSAYLVTFSLASRYVLP